MNSFIKMPKLQCELSKRCGEIQFWNTSENTKKNIQKRESTKLSTKKDI